jgi:hypothetical protein
LFAVALSWTSTDNGSPDRLLFEDAISAIQNKLQKQPPGTCSQHADVESFIAALEYLCQGNGSDRSRLVGCKDKSVLLADAFEGYFDLLSLHLEVKPEWQGRLLQLVEMVFKVRFRLPAVARC